MKRIIFIILMFFTSTAFPQVTEVAQKELPNLSIKDLDGKMVNIQDYAKTGKITILSFWATWCTHCSKELTNISELYDEWVANYGIELVAISIDNSRNVAKVKPYVDGHGMQFKVLLDTNEDVKRAMSVTQIPFTFLINKEGKIVYSHSGYAEGDEYELEEEIKKITQ